MRIHKALVLFTYCLLFSALLPAQNTSQSSARSYYLKGMSYLDESKLGKQDSLYDALDNFLLALEANPRYSQAIYAIADTYYQLEEYDRALDFLQQAENLGQSDSNIDILSGNIFLALGSVDRAEASFTAALNKNSNAFGAYIGKAEILLYYGKADQSLQYYQYVLERDPNNRKALLSLAIVSSMLYRFQDADIAIEQALRYHNNSPTVHETAAAYYLSRNDYERALFHAKTAFSNANSSKALDILADVSVKTGKLDAASDYSRQLIAQDSSNIDAWYKQGYIAEMAGDVDTAINSYLRALQIASQNELLRIALERVYINKLEFDDERRMILANNYFESGEKFYTTNQFTDALNIYRRGLRLDPYSVPLRKALADLYNTQREYTRYLQELQVLTTIQENPDRDITDGIETFSHTLANSVAFRWGIDQFSIKRPRYRIKILHYEQQSFSSNYLGMQELISWYSKELLQSQESLDVVPEASSIASFSDAIRMVHEEDLDYFIILEPQYTSRSFFSTATLYTASGSKQASAISLQSGLGMIRHSLETVLGSIFTSIPPRGRIIERSRNNVLFSMGSHDGIATGDELLVLEQGGITLKPEPPGFSFREEELIGRIQVSEVDALVSEGVFTSITPVDRLQQNDEVVFITQEEQKETMKPYTFLLPQPIFSLVRSFP